jgi:peroxidase
VFLRKWNFGWGQQPSLRDLEARAIDGTGNNETHTDYGAVGVQFLRTTPDAYDYDGGVYQPEEPRTNYRAMSNDIIKQDGEIPNSAGVSDLFTFFGQFIDHDIDLAIEGGEAGPYVVSPDDANDPYFAGRTLGITRTLYADGTGGAYGNPTQHTNAITSFIDASNVYGSSEVVMQALRDADKPWLMAMSPGGDLLPIGGQPGDQFQGGDVRAGENSALTSIHTIWAMEHNYQAEHLKKLHPHWSADDIFYAAKAIVEAELQQVAFNEWLPLLVGAENIPAYAGYDSNVDPTISHEFATAAFRFGHSLLSSDIPVLNENGQSAGSMELAQMFFNPSVLQALGSVDALVRGIASHQAQELDQHLVEDVRSLLFPGPDGIEARDLSVLNNLRGLDHGLGTLNEVRTALGMTPYASFAELASDPTLAVLLAEHYDSVGDVDLWVGGLIEQHVPGSQLGETFQMIVLDQFVRLRDGDRFYFEERLKDFPGLLAEIKETSFSDIIKRTTGIEHLQDDVFIAHDRIGGTNGKDNLSGDDGHDLIIGFAGADRLYGRGGDDDIYGDGGNDRIWGGDGRDVIDGGRGNDKMWGGADADQFVFAKHSGRDTICDFDVSQDVVDLSALEAGALSALWSIQTRAGVMLFLGHGDTLLIEGVKKFQLSADNFIFNHGDDWFV